MKFLFDLLYPPKCPLCDELHHDRNICENCFSSLHILEGDFTAPHLEKIWFNRAASCFAYEGKILDAIHGLKYSQRFDLVSVFAEYLAEKAGKISGYDLIIPVPLHWRRLWQRGYNQSALLAKSVGKKLGVEADCHILKKNRNIVPQVGLDREARLENIKGAFKVGPKKTDHLKGTKILLIDDVLTTGATVNECAKTLIKTGDCAIVDILTVARTI